MTSIREVELNSASVAMYDMDPNETRLQAGTTVRVGPMARALGGWNEIHFHPNLRLPMECPPSGGMVVTLEAMASECVAVALSPDSDFILGKTYVVHFGSNGNVATVIRRRLASGHEAVDVQIPSRVCSMDQYVSYWICLLPNGKLYCGVGEVPTTTTVESSSSSHCIGVLDDSLYNQLRSPIDAVKFVGLGNSALGRGARPIKIRNVTIMPPSDSVKATLEALDTDNLTMVNVDAQDDAETKAMMEAYEAECKKAKARAKKFGTEYKPPDPKSFMNWSKARRLRANPERGFATGMDIMTPEEQEKQRKRAERFGICTEKKRDRDGEDGTAPTDDADNNNDEMQEESVAIKEAWDNAKLTTPHRIDPPKQLWLTPPENIVEEESYSMVETAPPALASEKIHIFSIDWAAFKQIRTDDILAYFANYGPSYVEWLGELSCNVLFEDKFSAARAIQNMSQQLPSPPPEEVLTSSMSTTTTTTTIDNTEIVEGTEEMGQDTETMAHDSPPPPDLGNMGWQVGLAPIRKKQNDRYGRRGTKARVLMRVATTTDVLLQRPERHPRPPPGFSTKRILGPGSDFDTDHRQKRRRMEYNEEERGEMNTYNNNGDEHPLALTKGLSARRDGYSLEQMESERAVTSTTAVEEGDSEAVNNEG